MSKMKVQDATKELSRRAAKLLGDVTGVRTAAEKTLAEPRKIENGFTQQQEAEREEVALKDLYRRMVGFITSGAFTMHDDLKRIVREARVQPVVVADAIGGDPSFETDKRIANVREEFMTRPGTSSPSEYEAGFRLMAAARDMVRLNSSYSGDDAEGWLEHWEMFRSAGFEPGGDDEWLMERVQASAHTSVTGRPLGSVHPCAA